VAWLAERAKLNPGTVLADVGAGTGTLSRLLRQTVGHVVAVEPAAPMRRALADTCPDVLIVAANAERLPFADEALDAITVAHAFHHFDAAVALAEFHRVLPPAGVLALFWQRYETADPVNRLIGETVDRHVDRDRGIPLAFRTWRDRFDRAGLFELVDEASTPHTHVFPAAGLVRLFATSSDVISLPPQKRDLLLRDLDELAQNLPSTVLIEGRTEVELFRPM
jgi:SAM-dependent methyltransferase